MLSLIFELNTQFLKYEFELVISDWRIKLILRRLYELRFKPFKNKHEVMLFSIRTNRSFAKLRSGGGGSGLRRFTMVIACFYLFFSCKETIHEKAIMYKIWYFLYMIKMSCKNALHEKNGEIYILMVELC